jgi:N-acylglucosamine-6-phosphate 2-epimerase
MDKQELLHLIRGKMIISCQALPGEPLYDAEKSLMPYMAEAAKRAGAPMIRSNSARDVVAIKKATGLPVIGLIKKNYEGYEPYITPTMAEVDALVKAEADVIAFDCTDRKRGDGLKPGEYIREIRKKYPDSILLADISTYEEGVNAAENGIDMVSTTMSGYTAYSPQIPGPDFELAQKLAEKLSIPVLGEGRIHTPEDAVKMMRLGVFAIIVGGAITRPLEIAERFEKALAEAEK